MKYFSMYLASLALIGLFAAGAVKFWEKHQAPLKPVPMSVVMGVYRAGDPDPEKTRYLFNRAKRVCMADTVPEFDQKHCWQPEPRIETQ
jgi:hypothetical protein